jgi:tripeptidyl-peptidase-1
MMAVAQNSPTTYFWVTDNTTWSEWLFQVANMTHPPLVFSISYSSNEYDLTYGEFLAFSNMAIKLGVRGVTLVAAAGDDGALDSIARGNLSNCMYSPQFPASSPFVVAVGGTQGPESGTKEITCQSDLGGTITGGGGFSTFYKQPQYQRGVINTYFKTVNGTKKAPYSGFSSLDFNGNSFIGRGYPDVTLAAANYEIFIGGI